MQWVPYSKIVKSDKDNILEDFWKELDKSFDNDILNHYFFFQYNYNFKSNSQLVISVSMNISIKDIIKSASNLKELKKLTKAKDIIIKKYNKNIKFRVTGGNRGNGILKYIGEISKQPSNDQQELATIYAIENKTSDLAEISDKIGFMFDGYWGYHFSESLKLNDYKIKNKSIIRSNSTILHDATNNSAKKLFRMIKSIGYADSKDNWNPSDFWICNKGCNAIIKKLSTIESIPEYNDEMKRMFLSGDLVGVSLKKIEKGSTAEIDIVDPSNRKIVNYTYNHTDYKDGATNFIIKSKEGFNIRAGYKSSAGARNVYFEGRMAGTKVQLGAISKIQVVNIIKEKTGTDIRTIEKDKNKTRDDILQEIMKLTIETLKDEDTMQEMYYLSMKQSKDSSIYLKLH